MSRFLSGATLYFYSLYWFLVSIPGFVFLIHSLCLMKYFIFFKKLKNTKEEIY